MPHISGIYKSWWYFPLLLGVKTMQEIYKFFYKDTMTLVKSGDTVSFSGRSWTVWELVEAEMMMDSHIWCRSNDEEAFIVKADPWDFGVRAIKTKVDDDHYRVTTTDAKAHILNLRSGEAMTCDKVHYNKAVDDGMSVGQYFRKYF
jgi:hypothetical protein